MNAAARIISVDDHVVEPPDLWTSRVPRSFVDRAPRVVRERAVTVMNGKKRLVRSQDEGEVCDWWVYENAEMALVTGAAAVGFEFPDNDPTTFDDLHPGCWKRSERVADLDADGLSASLCFPNLFTRFCGQRFLHSEDKELGLACVRAYNDWMLEDWCAGDGVGRLLPLTLVPLWDVDLAVAEVKRCASKGSLAVAFSENPHQLGLPSIHSAYWDPFFRAAAESQMTVCMHIGSSSHVPTTSPDAPHIISTCTHFAVTAGSLLDFIFSGTLDRIPDLKLFFAESQAGWMPYVLEQADWLAQAREGSSLGASLRRRPSEYVPDRVYTSIYKDLAALRNIDQIGVGQVCFETDYPHSVMLYPNSTQIAHEQLAAAGLSDVDQYRVLRGNAIKAFGLERVGIRE
jgi:predicted TIM-barrel fold metal-dependent hydrolase